MIGHSKHVINFGRRGVVTTVHGTVLRASGKRSSSLVRRVASRVTCHNGDRVDMRTVRSTVRLRLVGDTHGSITRGCVTCHGREGVTEGTGAHSMFVDVIGTGGGSVAHRGTGVGTSAPTNVVVGFTSRAAGPFISSCLLSRRMHSTIARGCVRVRSGSCCPAGDLAYIRRPLSVVLGRNFATNRNSDHPTGHVRATTMLTYVSLRAYRGRVRKNRTVPTFSFCLTPCMHVSCRRRMGGLRGLAKRSLDSLCGVSVSSCLIGSLANLRNGRHLRRRTVGGAMGEMRRTVRTFVRGVGAVRSHNNGRIMFSSVGCNASADTRNHYVVQRVLLDACRNMKGKRATVFPVRV